MPCDSFRNPIFSALFKIMKVNCLYDKLVPVKELIPHKKNANVHPKEQIARLAEILKYQGWRYPIKISNRSGFITSGHGRLEAAKLNGWEKVPVNFQDYENEEQEFADVTADNSIASWAEIDLSFINNEMTNLGPDFDIDMLGIKDFVLEPAELLNENEANISFDFKLEIDCLNEQTQRELAEELENRNFKVRVLF